MYVYKTLNGLSPTYLSDCISIRVTSRSDIRSYQDKTRLEIPTCRCFSRVVIDLLESTDPLSGTSFPSPYARLHQSMCSNTT